MKSQVAIVGIEWDIVDLIESLPEFEIAGFIALTSNEIAEINYLGNDLEWEKIKKRFPDLKVVLALDDPNIKSHLFAHYGLDSLFTLISPFAYVSKRASVGSGSLIQRGATVMANVSIGMGCKLNVNSTVHHDVQIGDYSTIAPGAIILGRVVVEDRVYVGAGAIIRQRCRLGAGSIIGAGAVVVKDVPPGEVVVGVPAKRLQKKRLTDASELVLVDKLLS